MLADAETKEKQLLYYKSLAEKTHQQPVHAKAKQEKDMIPPILQLKRSQKRYRYSNKSYTFLVR